MRSALLVGLLMASTAAHAQTRSPGAPGETRLIPGDFVRAGEGFGCIHRDGPPPEDLRMEDCLRLGPLSIDMNRKEAEALLGRHLAKMEDGRGINFVYALAWSGEADDAELLTYVALRYDDADRVAVLQMSGAPAPGKRWAFSSVALGDSEQVLLTKLGRPFGTEPVPFNGAQLWSYGIWPFSFEIKNSKVISIRLQKPEPAS